MARSEDGEKAFLFRGVVDGHAFLFCRVQKITCNSTIFSILKNTYFICISMCPSACM